MTETRTRTVAKIDIIVKVDVPDPMPMMLTEHVGSGKNGVTDINVSRNMTGNLLLINIGKNGYVVDVSEIVKGLLEHENGNVVKTIPPEE